MQTQVIILGESPPAKNAGGVQVQKVQTGSFVRASVSSWESEVPRTAFFFSFFFFQPLLNIIRRVVIMKYADN